MPSEHYDTIIIGAGISGCAAARALSKYRLNVLVLEAQDDLACGASKANSGIVHAGYDCYPGTLKAKLNVEGASLFPTWAEELDIPFKVNGSLVLCFHEEEHSGLEELYRRGQTNGVPGLMMLNGKEAYEIEPNLADGLHSALWAKNAGIISPYEAAIAMAENAAENGVDFLLDAEVTNITKKSDGSVGSYIVECKAGKFTADTIINAAGIHADTIHNFIAVDMVCNQAGEEILPQRGEYYLIDNAFEGYVNCTLFPLPGPKGKGVLIAPTVDGNIIVGPNAEDLTDRADVGTTRMGLDEIFEKANLSVSGLPLHGRITTFAGIRAKHKSKDFVMNEPLPGFFNALGIDSPGLSAAPAIGVMLADMVAGKLNPDMNSSYNPRREGIVRFASLSFEEKEALIQQNPKYGHMVCRCETVTEAEIISAIHRPVGAKTLSALKRRTRAQMGRCQGGFCSLKLGEILAKELKISEESIWTY